MATFAVAVDGSKHSQEAFTTACRLLNPTKDRLLVVTCAENASKHLLPILTNKEKEALTARIERAQKAILQPYVELAEDNGVPVTRVMLQGHHAGHMLCAFVDEHQVDFLVVGRRGMNRVQAGSTSKYVMDHARCNVVVVKGYFSPEQQFMSIKQEVEQIQQREMERLRRLDEDEDAEFAELERKEWMAARGVRCEDIEWRRPVSSGHLIGDYCEVFQFDSDDDY